MFKRLLDRLPRGVAFWIAGTVALLVQLLAGVLSAGRSFSVPITPIDHVNGVYARQWVLLQESKGVIPIGQSYTTLARDPDDEMTLFMLSLGVLPDRPALATSYWKIPYPDQGNRARYVVSLDCVEPSGLHRLARRLSNGCVWERPESLR